MPIRRTDPPSSGSENRPSGRRSRKPLPAGAYRAIPASAPDDPRLVGLGPDPRHLHLLLWIRCRHGIAHLTALLHQLAAQTGMPPLRVRKALDDLAAAGVILWNEQEGVVWLFGALEADPGVRPPENRQQLIGFASCVAGLPRTSLVMQFCEHYRVSHSLPDTLFTQNTNTNPNRTEAEAPRPPASGASDSERKRENPTRAPAPRVEPAPSRLLELAKEQGLQPPPDFSDPGRQAAVAEKKRQFLSSLRQTGSGQE